MALDRAKYSQRLRTGWQVNWHLLQGLELTPNGYPIMRPAKLPPGINRLVGFNEALTARSPGSCGVHFWIDDYQFERAWQRPEAYLDVLRRFAFVVEPDFSTYTDYPLPLQHWNYYRSKLLAAWWQTQGITVIPYPGGEPDDPLWEFTTEGVPLHSDIAFSTVGFVRYRALRERLPAMLRYRVARFAPTGILVYGQTTPELEAALAQSGVPWRQFSSGMTGRIRAYRKMQEEDRQHAQAQ